MDNIHYLDNSATTKPCEEALAAAREAMEIWGNPSSVHSAGREAAHYLEGCREKIAKSLGMKKFSKDRLILTSCGTESDNIALLGALRAKKRDAEHPGTVIISAGEHPAIDGPASLAEKEGYELFRIPTLHGILDTDALKEAVESAKAPVVFAGFMLVNNETGALYDVKTAADIVRAKYPDALIHCDAVQGYMKTAFTPYSLGVDTLAVSAHKIHALRGAGALFVSENVIKRRNLTAVMPGGGQEGGYRSGTENLVSIASMAAAAECGKANFAENFAKTEALRGRLDAGLDTLGLRRNLPDGARVADICSVVLPQIRSETMLNYLSGRGICVSAGSACAANSKKKSAALEAFGVSANDADCTLRISISHTNNEEDIDALLCALGDGISALQKKR